MRLARFPKSLSRRRILSFVERAKLNSIREARKSNTIARRNIERRSNPNCVRGKTRNRTQIRMTMKETLTRPRIGRATRKLRHRRIWTRRTISGKEDPRRKSTFGTIARKKFLHFEQWSPPGQKCSMNSTFSTDFCGRGKNLWRRWRPL